MGADKRDKNPHSGKILVIDDDSGILYTLKRMAEEEGHPIALASTLEEGIPIILEGDVDVLFLDVRLPDGSGIDAIPEIQAVSSPPEIIILTAFSDRDGARCALKCGVWDYIEKPARIDTLKLSLKRALQYRSQKRTLEEPLSLKREGIIGESATFLMCITLMAHAAKCEANVLISGETGTGKELFARAIHKNSSRSNRPFVVVDCAALPQNLTESILFGHTKGAFTGATSEKTGLIKEADGGTLFLDEVGDLPLILQKKLLRVLQERKFRPLGSKREIQSQFRLISATHRDLMADVNTHQFRKDLLFRLRSLVIDIPPLKDRRKDIPDISHYHLLRFSREMGYTPKKISQEVYDLFYKYDWPGNVRELVHTLESALVTEPLFPILYPKHLPEHIRSSAISGKKNEAKHTLTSINPKDIPTLKTYRRQCTEEAERTYLEWLLSDTREDVQKTLQISGLKRARLYELMKKHGLSFSKG